MMKMKKMMKRFSHMLSFVVRTALSQRGCHLASLSTRHASLIMPLSSLIFLLSCSTTSSVPEGDRLYTGIDKVTYSNYEKNDHFTSTQMEVAAALDCPPNGALFGSSYYRTPLQWRLWTWNKFSDKETGFAKWMTKSFGKAPVLMSNVNPELRASVAQSALKVHGYFRGKVTSKEVDSKNPKKAKVKYLVDMGHLFTIDTLIYENFTPETQALIDSTREEALVRSGVPFDVSALDAERTRISTLFRDNGFYYYQPGYASYLADTLAVPGKVQMRLQLADSLPEVALRKWYIGKLDVSLKRSFMEQTTDTTGRGRFRVHFNGKRSPIRTRVVMKDLKLRPGRMYNYTDYIESANKLSSNGLFSLVDFNFTPRDSSATCDSLDLSLNCVFDKPYDFYVETNLKGKTTGFLGPQLIVGLTKRNAFRGGENLNINLHGAYEWQTGHAFDKSSSELNSYEYGGDVSIDFPRLVLPWNLNDRRRPRQGQRRRRSRFYYTPATTVKASTSIVNRSGFFKRHIVSGELTYRYQFGPSWAHQFTPLSVEYNYLKHGTEKFIELLSDHPYLMATMSDLFIPKLKYTLTYTSPATQRHPIFWQVAVSESANLLSLGYMAFGNSWNKKDKEMFKNPYAQFLKLETDFTKTWRMDEHSQLVGHLSLGYAWAYGNSSYIPYTENFWVGGANSIRAFTVRSIGPGNYRSSVKRWRFVEQIGNFKLQANLEYRPRLFGNLYGAVFLDAGNVWITGNNDYEENTKFKFSKLHDQMALGTGIGLRYNLDYFVVRLDWGIALHAPYDTGKSGYFNIPSLGDGNSIHFAIGYPF